MNAIWSTCLRKQLIPITVSKTEFIIQQHNRIKNKHRSILKQSSHTKYQEYYIYEYVWTIFNYLIANRKIIATGKCLTIKEQFLIVN